MRAVRRRLGAIRRQLLGLNGLDPHLEAIDARVDALDRQVQRLSASVTSLVGRATDGDAPSFPEAGESIPIVYRELGQRHRGQLGNQLWQIAGTLGIAATLNTKARFPDWHLKGRFSIPEEYFSTEPLVGRDAASIPTHITDRHRPFLQDVGLWHQIESTIHGFFSPSEPTRTALEEKFADFLALPTKTALHVRRGEYLLYPDRHPIPSENYFRGAVEMLPATNVVVFSDDIEWSRQHLSWAKPAAVLDGNADYEDLFLMARCQHHIISNSSFSWWGAFLSRDRNTIFPKRWYGQEYRDADPTLMFVEGWIGLDG